MNINALTPYPEKIYPAVRSTIKRFPFVLFTLKSFPTLNICCICVQVNNKELVIKETSTLRKVRQKTSWCRKMRYWRVARFGVAAEAAATTFPKLRIFRQNKERAEDKTRRNSVL